MSNKSPDTKAETENWVSLRKKEIMESCKKHGIPFEDTSEEHAGQTTLFFSMKRSEIEAAEEPDKE